MNETISRIMQVIGCSKKQAVLILEEIERQKDYAKTEERKNTLELLRLKVLCRVRGLSIDIHTQENKDYYRGAKNEMQELYRHLEELKWIDAYISCAKKYLSDVEKHEFMILRENLGFQEDENEM